MTGGATGGTESAGGLSPPREPAWRRGLRRGAETAPLVRAYLHLCDLTGRTPRNDLAWRHLHRWLAAAPTVRPQPRRRLLMFAVQPHWVDMSLALAAVLIARGDAVDFVWGETATHLPDVPPPLLYGHWLDSARRMQARFAHPHLRTIALENMSPGDEDDGMRVIAEAQALADTSYALRRERLDLGSGTPDAAEFARRSTVNRDVLRRMRPLLDRHAYDRLLMPSGGILEFGAVHRLASRLGLPATTYEFPDAHGRIMVSAEGAVTGLPTAALWRDAPRGPLSAAERTRIAAQLIESRQSRHDDPAAPSFQRAGMAAPGAVRAALDLPPPGDGRRVVLLCCNVPYDAIFYTRHRHLFAGMWEWLIETLRFLAGRPDCVVVVRAHPAEPRFDTPETAEALLREAFARLPDNVRFVGPLSPVNTFAIMQVADIGAVYASTTGLEMAMRGLHVVCGNPDQHYNGKGFTIDPPDRSGYFAALAALVENGERRRLAPAQTDDALRYADLYFNEWPRPFPWHLATFWRDVRAWPPARVAGADGEARFGPTLSLF
ncbi:MAG: hypothetical protein ACK4QW_05775 [Alphaproteobacteria bacterium]